jgi:hypothetical protein
MRCGMSAGIFLEKRKPVKENRGREKIAFYVQIIALQ